MFKLAINAILAVGLTAWALVGSFAFYGMAVGSASSLDKFDLALTIIWGAVLAFIWWAAVLFWKATVDLIWRKPAKR